MTATQSEVSACDQISGDCVINHIHRLLTGCCPGLWKWTDRVPDIYGSTQRCFMALVIGRRIGTF